MANIDFLDSKQNLFSIKNDSRYSTIEFSFVNTSDVGDMFNKFCISYDGFIALKKQ